MTPRLGPILSVADLPEAELCALRLDGDAYEIDGCAAPIDEPYSHLLRAAALAAQLPPRLIVELQSAAWVWGALASPPPRQQVCADIGARTRPAGLHRMVIREVVIDEGDVVTLAGVKITTPLRTAIDLARFSSTFDARDRGAVTFLMRLGTFGVSECAAVMGRRRNLPNKKLALIRLEQSAPSRGES